MGSNGLAQHWVLLGMSRINPYHYLIIITLVLVLYHTAYPEPTLPRHPLTLLKYISNLAQDKLYSKGLTNIFYSTLKPGVSPGFYQRVDTVHTCLSQRFDYVCKSSPTQTSVRFSSSERPSTFVALPDWNGGFFLAENLSSIYMKNRSFMRLFDRDRKNRSHSASPVPLG